MRTAASYGRQRYDRRSHHDDPQGVTRENSGPVVRLRPEEIAHMKPGEPTKRRFGRANVTRIRPRRTWAEMFADLEMMTDDVLCDLEEGNAVDRDVLEGLSKVSAIVRAHHQIDSKDPDGAGDVDFTVK